MRNALPKNMYKNKTLQLMENVFKTTWWVGGPHLFATLHIIVVGNVVELWIKRHRY